MGEFLKQFGVWLRSVFSEPDGTGSSARVLTFLLALVSSGILWRVFTHLTHLTEVGILSLWLTALPMIVACLVLFLSSPYGINKGTISIMGLFSMLTGRKPSDPPAA